MNSNNFSNLIPQQYFDETFVQRSLLQLHIESGITIFLNGLLMYLILFHTPKNMGIYKYYLLNITIWPTIFDLYTSLIWSPILLLPAPVICTRSVLEPWIRNVGGVEFLLVLHPILTAFCMASIVCGSTYRFFLFTEKLNFLHSKYGICMMANLHITTGLPCAILFYLMQIEKNNKDIEILNEYPDIYDFYKSNTCASVSIYSKITQIAVGFAIFSYFAFIFVAFLMYVGTNAALLKQRNQMSDVTYKLHKRMLVITTIQFCIPIASMLFPFLSLVCNAVIFKKRIKEFNPWVFGTFSMHSILNALIIICAIKAYYEIILKWIHLSKFFTSNDNQVSVLVSSTALQI